MEKDETNSLFDIGLNQEGIAAIKKFAKAAKWVMLLIILISLISLTETFTAYFITDEKYYIGNRLLMFQRRIYPYYTFVYCFLAYVQAYNYVKTGKRLSSAIDNNDEMTFNRSFVYLLRNSIFAIVTLFWGLLMGAFQLYILIESFYNK